MSDEASMMSQHASLNYLPTYSQSGGPSAYARSDSVDTTSYLTSERTPLGGGEKSGEQDQDMVGRIAILEGEVDRLEVQLEMEDDQDDRESPPDYSALSHSNSLR